MRVLLFLLPLVIATPLVAIPLPRPLDDGSQSGVKQKAVVNAVLFYSPKCPHCHRVMDETIKPLTHKYGDQLEIVMVNIDTDEGQEVFKNAMRKYSIPKSKRVVPFMVVGSTLLIGSEEIDRRLAFLIDKGVAAGGRKPPKIKGLESQVDEALSS